MKRKVLYTADTDRSILQQIALVTSNGKNRRVLCCKMFSVQKSRISSLIPDFSGFLFNQNLRNFMKTKLYKNLLRIVGQKSETDTKIRFFSRNPDFSGFFMHHVTQGDLRTPENQTL